MFKKTDAKKSDVKIEAAPRAHKPRVSPDALEAQLKAFVAHCEALGQRDLKIVMDAKGLLEQAHSD